MATKDKYGNLHSENNGKFISKGAEEVAHKYEKYEPDEEVNYKSKLYEKAVKVNEDNVVKIDTTSDFQKRFDQANGKERQKLAFNYIMDNLLYNG